MLGEELSTVVLDSRGVVSDRLYAVRGRDGKLGSGKSTRRFRAMRGLSRFRAYHVGEYVVVVMPDLESFPISHERIDAVLSERLGEEVTLVREDEISHFDAGAVHIVTSSTLLSIQALLPHRQIDAIRLRPNLVLDTPDLRGFVEDAWIRSNASARRDSNRQNRAAGGAMCDGRARSGWAGGRARPPQVSTTDQ